MSQENSCSAHAPCTGVFWQPLGFKYGRGGRRPTKALFASSRQQPRSRYVTALKPPSGAHGPPSPRAIAMSGREPHLVSPGVATTAFGPWNWCPGGCPPGGLITLSKSNATRTSSLDTCSPDGARLPRLPTSSPKSCGGVSDKVLVTPEEFALHSSGATAWLWADLPIFPRSLYGSESVVRRRLQQHCQQVAPRHTSTMKPAIPSRMRLAIPMLRMSSYVVRMKPTTGSTYSGSVGASVTRSGMVGAADMVGARVGSWETVGEAVGAGEGDIVPTVS